MLTESDPLEATIRDLEETLSPVKYITRVFGEPYEWQKVALNQSIKRLILLCCRQAGKSTISAGRTIHKAKHERGALNLIISPSEKQSTETVGKISDFITRDEGFPNLIKNSTFEKELPNGSRIVALPGTEKSVRGYSGPKIILFDEASRTLDETYYAATPMLTDNPDSTLILLSTPHGKRGFFWEAWEKQKGWTKILVKPAYKLVGNKLVRDMPEAKFREMWAAKGVHAFYSPRHKKEWLEEELDRFGPWWFRQEYMCEFIETMTTLFPTDLIESSMDFNIQPIFQDSNLLDDKVEVLNV